MKQLISFTLMLAMCAWFVSPAMVSATDGIDTTEVTTQLTKDTSGGAAPIVKAKWEADAEGTTGVLDYYRDDRTVDGAQFFPSGVYQDNREIAICAIATDPDGLSDVDNVYADVFYPEGIALGDHHTPLTDQSGEGCGVLMQEDTLQRLTKDEGYNLFCQNVRENNYGLPTFNDGYGYDEICAADGELMKETAAVYCATKEISYEDPSGHYEVWAIAQDKNGQQGTLANSFEYLPVTAFETDFTSVDYGNVRLNTHKIISGDLTWGGDKASVRNVGNTRLAMRVWQDDMNFGKTDGNWNVKYDARVGSNAPFANYWPETTKTLSDELDLSELDEMDFSILVYKFPPTEDAFTGNMTLSAVYKSHLACETATNDITTQ